MERKAFYKDEGRPSSSARSPGELSQVLQEIQETNSEESQLIDASVAVDFAKLHLAIEKGELDAVKSIVEIQEGEEHFSHDGISALYKAFNCEEYKIISFLIHSGAKFVGSEDKDVYDLNIDLDRVNYHLFQYNRKSERSCVYWSISKSPQDLDPERHRDVMAGHEYLCETYVKGQFWAIEIDRSIFVRFPADTVILIHGLQSWECKELSINESQVQWLNGQDDKIQKGKVIFICNDKFLMNFKDFVRKTTVENRICMRYDRKMFYLMNSVGEAFKEYEKEIRQTEEEMIDWLKNNKILIVSENAGCGKSTVMSHLIRLVKERFHNSLVLRVDLNKFSIKDEGSDSKEETYEDIFLMFGFKNGFEQCHFREGVNKDNCFIFLDAFNEIPSEYKGKALKLISFLRNETSARIMITTRMHHQKELEEILNTFSHQLVPFDNLTQVTYMGNLWKWKLKFPNGEGGQNHKKAISEKMKSIISELEKEKVETDLVLALKEINLEDSVDSIRRKIDGLELNALANSILRKTSLDKETQEFMGIPLHLFMTGVIHWDNNFNVNISSGIHSIYTQFIQMKIVIYVEDKQNMPKNEFYDDAVEKTRHDVYRIHTKLAKQLFEEGKINSEMSEEDFKLCKALGIVFIKGEDVEFLHLTFAEYFIAESIWVGLDRQTLRNVLFENKFTVVRRFLESSLKEKDFENISEEVLTDLDFLFKVLKEFVAHFSIFSDNLSRLYSKSVSSANIIKCLFKKFEETVDSDFLNAFVRKIELELFSLEYWHLIGGCLTLKIMKMLINENFNVTSKIIFGMVLYHSNPNDVIEILNECISISDESEINERERAEKLLKILELTDKNGWNLFDYALLNERIQVFVRILKYFKEILGNQIFVDEIIKSEKYWIKTLDDMIKKQGIYKVIELMKKLYSVFGDEIEAFFDEYHKFRIIWECLKNSDESGNKFQETIKLFIQYFGNANIKKTLLSCDSGSDYLIHYLVKESKNATENHLNIIKKYLDEGSEIQQFLKFKDRLGRNVFYLSADRRKDNLDVILRFCSKYLKKEEMKEMLISCDALFRMNVLHLLFKKFSSEGIVEILNLIKKYLDDENLLKECLKSKSNYSMNIIHYAARNNNELNISLLNSYLSNIEIKVLLIERDIDDRTCLHYGAIRNSKKLLTLLNYSFEIMKDEYRLQFKELIFVKSNKWNGTFLNMAAMSIHFKLNDLTEIIESLKEKVSEEIFKE